MVTLAGLGPVGPVATAQPTLATPPGEQDDRQRRLARPPFDRPDFFPIGVWIQHPKNAARYRAAGINLYVGLWKGPTGAQLVRLKRSGMWVVAAQNDLALGHPDRDIIIGWLHGDEPDNAQPLPGGKGYGPPVAPAKVVADYRRLLRRDGSRPVLLNLGQGVAWDRWYGRRGRTNHPEDYPHYVKGADIVSFDIYPATHSHPAVAGRLEYVAHGVSRLKRWARDGQRVWSTVGATRIKNPHVKPTPGQVRAQVWMSLIHGSRGIVYFVHQFKPRFIEAGLFAEPELLRAVTSINRRIHALAPVLNRPSVAGAVTVMGGPVAAPIATMVKRHEGRTYLFAVSMSPKRTSARFRFTLPMSMPMPMPSRHGTVLGENRRVSIDAKSLEDDFGPYGVHLYRFD